jgi:hypothetical protein
MTKPRRPEQKPEPCDDTRQDMTRRDFLAVGAAGVFVTQIPLAMQNRVPTGGDPTGPLTTTVPFDGHPAPRDLPLRESPCSPDRCARPSPGTRATLAHLLPPVGLLGRSL